MKVEWSLAARNDLDQIQAYIERDCPRAAERMWVRIHDRVTLQASMPLAAPIHGDGRVDALRSAVGSTTHHRRARQLAREKSSI